MSQVKLPLLKLRKDLQFSLQSYGNERCYLLEDPVNASYFRIGLDEYQLLQALDGENDWERLIKNQLGDLDPQQLPLLVHWLIQNQLAYVKINETWQLSDVKKDKFQVLAQSLNWLFIKIPVGSPDRLLTYLLPFLRPLLGWGFFTLWLLVVITGLWQMISHFDRFTQSADQLLSIHNATYLIAAWLIIKTLHELFHGLVCKNYGGYIHQAGVMLILFAPIGGYVNATSSWKLTSRWQRIHVSFAGMYIELFLAAIAAWIWVYTEAGQLNFLAYNVIVIASIATLLFNANPLMRFDGYYILTDMVNIPNLYTLGQKYVIYLNQRYLQGRKIPDPLQYQTRAWFIRFYGISALIWRWLVTVTLIVLAHLLWHGAGFILAVLAAFVMVILPLLRFALQLPQLPQRAAILTRLLLMVGLGGGLVIFLLMHLHWSPRLIVPAVVDYAQETLIRVDTPGTLREILVQTGQSVKKGELLLVLDNFDLTTDYEDLHKQIKIVQLKQQQLLQQQHLAEHQAEAEKLLELQRKMRELDQQIKALMLYAPHDGKALIGRLEENLQRYLTRGTELLSIAEADRFQIMLSIAQQDIDAFRGQEGVFIRFMRDSDPHQYWQARLTQIKPTASSYIHYPALTALGGGNLAVKRRAESTENQETNQQELYEHLQPRFMAIATFESAPNLPHFTAGETGKIAWMSPSQTVWQSLQWGITRYLQGIIEQAELLQGG
jgi:putative peptide zinc metalloprotease protein